MKKPLISVIIPSYNEEKYILASVKSIVQQDFPKNKYEVILVDSSTDKTTEIVQKNYPLVKIVKDKKRGIVCARIKGEQQAKGEIVAYLDADSIAPKDWLTKIEKAYKDKEVVAVGGLFDLQPKTKIVLFNKILCHWYNLIFKTMPGQNLSFKKSAYKKVGGFTPNINIGEDIYISMALKKAGKVIILKDNKVITSSRRVLDGNIIFGLKFLINMFTVMYLHKPFVSDAKPVRDKGYL